MQRASCRTSTRRRHRHSKSSTESSRRRGAEQETEEYRPTRRASSHEHRRRRDSTESDSARTRSCSTCPPRSSPPSPSRTRGASPTYASALAAPARWRIKAVSDAHIADIPFEQLEDVGRPKTDTTQVAAIATNAKGGRKGAKRFPGKCFACSRPGHRVSECHDKTALAQYNRHKAAAITPTSTATAGQGATTSSSSSSSGTSS